jgi:hypothetical protein
MESVALIVPAPAVEQQALLDGVVAGSIPWRAAALLVLQVLTIASACWGIVASVALVFMNDMLDDMRRILENGGTKADQTIIISVDLSATMARMKNQSSIDDFSEIANALRPISSSDAVWSCAVVSNSLVSPYLLCTDTTSLVHLVRLDLNNQDDETETEGAQQQQQPRITDTLQVIQTQSLESYYEENLYRERIAFGTDEPREALIELQAVGPHRSAKFTIDEMNNRDTSDCRVYCNTSAMSGPSRIGMSRCFDNVAEGFMHRSTLTYGDFPQHGGTLALGMTSRSGKNKNMEESYRFRLDHPWSLLDILPNRGDVISEGHVKFYSQSSPVQVMVQNDSCDGGTHGQNEDSGLYWYTCLLHNRQHRLDITLKVRPVTVPPVPSFSVWSEDRRLVLVSVMDRNRW